MSHCFLIADLRFQKATSTAETQFCSNEDFTIRNLQDTDSHNRSMIFIRNTLAAFATSICTTTTQESKRNTCTHCHFSTVTKNKKAKKLNPQKTKLNTHS
jgi:hypothetical protein